MTNEELWNEVTLYSYVARAIEVALVSRRSIRLISKYSRVEHIIRYCQENNIYCTSSTTCPCGNYLDSTVACTCSIEEIKRHRRNLDLSSAYIVVEVPRLYADAIVDAVLYKRQRESEARMLARVVNAQTFFAKNKDLNTKLADDTISLLKAAIKQLALELHDVRHILDVAADVAALDASKVIKAHHLAEALQYQRHEKY